jgi:hypothetical protein
MHTAKEKNNSKYEPSIYTRLGQSNLAVGQPSLYANLPVGQLNTSKSLLQTASFNLLARRTNSYKNKFMYSPTNFNLLLKMYPCVLQNAWMATGDSFVCARAQTSAVCAPSLMGYAWSVRQGSTALNAT